MEFSAKWIYAKNKQKQIIFQSKQKKKQKASEQLHIHTQSFTSYILCAKYGIWICKKNPKDDLRS